MSNQLDVKFEIGGTIEISKKTNGQNVIVITEDTDRECTVVQINRSESFLIARHLIQQFGFTEEELRV